MTLAEYIKSIREEFPDFRIREKSKSTFMKVIDVVLKIITFGQMRKFMSSFTTTVGDTVYTPAKWERMPESSRIRILRHELVHLRQKKRYTFLLFGFLYLFVPLPIGLAYFRMKFEKEAYEETMRSLAETHGVVFLKDEKYKKAMVDHFTTAAYFWMWPFRGSLERWYDGVVEEIEQAR